MNSRLPLVLLVTLAAWATRLSAAPAATAPAPTPPPTRLTAVFIENRAGPAFADKALTFQALLDSRLAGAGFNVVARDTALTALSTLSAGGPPTAANQALDDQSSALRLAQNLGAQYLLVATLGTYGTNERAFRGYGVDFATSTATLRVAYRFCDATHGGTLTGDTVTVSQKIANTANLTEVDNDMANKLLDQAAAELADAFILRMARSQPLSSGKSSLADFSVSCSMGDLVLPDILRTPDGQYVVGALNYSVAPVDVTVSLNGVALGSAPGTLNGPVGLSTLRLSREGFKTWEQFVNISPGFNLRVALQMTDAGYARWQNSITFLQGLKSGTKLTDAEVQKILGIAESFRQSGLRFDQRSDIKIEANQLPQIQQNYQSLFSNPAPLIGAPAPVAPAGVK